MEGNKSKLFWGLAIGAAAGVVIGYLLSGKKVEDLGSDIKKMADNLKENLNDAVNKGKEAWNDVQEPNNSSNSNKV